jgi:hypothetical protein
MSSIGDKAATATTNLHGRSVVPFTSGIFAIYAFFCPESFGTWFGTIIRCIRAAGGF